MVLNSMRGDQRVWPAHLPAGKPLMLLGMVAGARTAKPLTR
jgi:hypothetical protein